MTLAQLFGMALATGGGIAVATQAPINAALGRALGGALPAAAVSFAVGFVALAALVALGGQAGAAARLPQVAPWQLLGGLLGAFYVWSIVTAVPALGVVTSVAALILGQMAAAITIDHFGALGVGVQPVTPARLAAVALVAAGLILSRI